MRIQLGADVVGQSLFLTAPYDCQSVTARLSESVEEKIGYDSGRIFVIAGVEQLADLVVDASALGGMHTIPGRVYNLKLREVLGRVDYGLVPVTVRPSSRNEKLHVVESDPADAVIGVITENEFVPAIVDYFPHCRHV